MNTTTATETRTQTYSQISVWRDITENYSGMVETTTPDHYGIARNKMRAMVAKFTDGDVDTLADFDHVWPDLGCEHGTAKRIGRGKNMLTVSLQWLRN